LGPARVIALALGLLFGSSTTKILVRGASGKFTYFLFSVWGIIFFVFIIYPFHFDFLFKGRS
jgi:hypothetical protein